MSNIINGRAVAEKLKILVTQEVEHIKQTYNFIPELVAICIGDDPASQVYLKAKSTQAQKVGLKARVIKQPADVAPEKLVQLIAQLNQDPQVSGILLQLPLPKPLDPYQFVNLLDPQKDVDGLTIVNAGALANDHPELVPCTPMGCILLLRQVMHDLTGQNAVVLGRSPLVGKPLVQMLLAENCTVTLAHSKTKHLPDVCRQADIIIAAVGRPHLVKKDWLKPGVIVLDVGINRLDDGKLVGDVDFAEALSVSKAITPVPGGVGPMTVACLLLNTVLAAARQHNFELSVLPLQPLQNGWSPA